MATSEAPKSRQALESQAYKRMKEANPDVFEPKTIYIATEKSIDWKNSLQWKEAIVYHAITGDHVSMKTKANAKELLGYIAKSLKEKLKQFSDAEGTDAGCLTSCFYELQFKTGFFLWWDSSRSSKKTQNARVERKQIVFTSRATHSQEIVKDIIKIENQVSLKLIKDIADNVEDVIKNNATVKQLRGENKLAGDYKLSFKQDGFEGIISRFCWYYSPFHSAAEPKKLEKEVIEKEKLENLLHCLHFSLRSKTDEEASGEVSRSPGARQLKRSGVRFEASTNATIDVRFSEPKLRMPALVYDFKLETVVGNLLAWERVSTEEEKPVTRYFQFMNELVGDLGDVRVMKKFGLVKGTWKNLREVLDLVKRADGPASYPSVYMALDKEICKARDYHDGRMKKFYVRNRPAVLWFSSSVAAASVIATAIYVTRKKV